MPTWLPCSMKVLASARGAQADIRGAARVLAAELITVEKRSSEGKHSCCDATGQGFDSRCGYLFSSFFA